jgi:TonB family protein
MFTNFFSRLMRSIALVVVLFAVSSSLCRAGDSTKTAIVYAFDQTKLSDGLEKGDSTIINSPTDSIAYDQEAQINESDLRQYCKYPEYALRAQIEGIVKLRLLIDRSGSCVKGYVVSSESDMLDEAAIYAVRHSRFRPAIKDNKKIASWVELPIAFFFKRN